MSRQAAILYANREPQQTRVRDWKTWKQTQHSGKGVFQRWGIIKEYHNPTQLLCDFDTTEIPSPPLQSLAHTLGLKIIWQRWDRTRHGWHLIVKLRQHLQNGECIAAQSILGSDPARERLNLSRTISIRLHPSKFWEKRINLLFKRKIRITSRRAAHDS